MSSADPKPERRIIDRLLMRALHAQWRECALCGEHRRRLSLHHVWNKPRHDVRENLVMLCGDGVSGCHGLITAGDRDKRRELGLHLLDEREDVVDFLARMHEGDAGRARAWIQRTLYV